MDRSMKLFKAFKGHLLAILVLLVVEFVLGMYTALFVEFPDSLANGNAWAWSMSQSPVVLLHIIVGTLLFLAALVVLVLSFLLRSKAANVTGILGFVTIVVAYLSGSTFLSDISQNSYSFTMSLGFIAAAVVYGVGYYLLRPSTEPAS
jgi:hypothetical protein